MPFVNPGACQCTGEKVTQNGFATSPSSAPCHAPYEKTKPSNAPTTAPTDVVDHQRMIPHFDITTARGNPNRIPMITIGIPNAITTPPAVRRLGTNWGKRIQEMPNTNAATTEALNKGTTTRMSLGPSHLRSPPTQVTAPHFTIHLTSPSIVFYTCRSRPAITSATDFVVLIVIDRARLGIESVTPPPALKRSPA